MGFLTLLLSEPQLAMREAREALYAWYRTVAPSLTPFFVVLPALTSREAREAYARLFGKLTPLWGFPGRLAGALVCGILGGSPAGAAALAASAGVGEISPSEATRCALMASGASPVYLLCSLGSGALSSESVGWLLLRSQLGAVLLSGCIFRFCFAGRTQPVSGEARESGEGAIWLAVKAVLGIGGYMVFFGVLAARLGQLLHPAMELPLLCALEFAGGCARLTAQNLPDRLLVPLLSAVSCFGGLSVASQCMAHLRGLGVRWRDYLPGKLLQAALAALLTAAQQALLSGRTAQSAAVFRHPHQLAWLLAALCVAGAALLMAKTKRENG